ncbi:hypothetical protein IC611_02310 [Proteus mirabilis]
MEIYVYADWTESTDPVLVGTLRSSEIRGKEHFSFSYDKTWLTSIMSARLTLFKTIRWRATCAGR